MGSAQSYPGLTQDVLEEYASLTYLTKGEILYRQLFDFRKKKTKRCVTKQTLYNVYYLMKKFYSIDPVMIKNNYHHRFSREYIVNRFCVLKNNPFQDRIFSVFSSKDDDCFSFEDMVDLCSALSAGCPAEVKAAWAFRIFDLDEDGQITENDISRIVDRLTWSVIDNRNIMADNHIDRDSKLKIATVILDEINLDKSGGIGLNEFKLIMARLPEFPSSFYFRL